MDSEVEADITCVVAGVVVGGTTGSGGVAMVFSLLARRSGWGWGSDMFTDKACPLSTY